ncbi:MAG: tyrosine-type recombinase/integrase [Propionibacteriaceae bacterium]|uniref:tyrosine-type recombinase/integrase n=1 Tax=Gordonia sp. UBA5067 TaxID=1946575 RepID=UPI0025C3B9A4|nr:tyrosine-type recombinase/integrase [Gordonia sp. UBA5067]
MSALGRARELGAAPYDRQVLIEYLVEQMRGWRFRHRYDDSRMLSAVRASFDVTDQIEGATLADRWATFEVDVWRRWLAGQDRPPLAARWGFGVWALVISRLVQPAWSTIATVRIGDWTNILPADDPLVLARQRIEDAAQTCAIGHPRSYDQAVNMATRLMLTRGADRLEDLTDADLLIPPASTKGADVLDVLLCQLGVFDRTPRSGTARRRTAPRHTERELALVAGVPEPFVEVVGLYLEAYARRLSDTYPTLRHKASALGHFFRYLQQTHPGVTSCAQITPAQARGFVPAAVELARTSQRTKARKGDADSTTAHSWLIEVRVFFADISTWATETDSPFAAHAPSSVVLTRHDLLDTGFVKARKRQQARLTSTVLDLQREIPNIRAFALRRWHDTGHALRNQPDDTTLIRAERAAFWDWALPELLLTSGLRIEEACELTTFDVLRRSLPDGRLYYLLHIKPSKFDRARVIPIGDQLGRVIAEIIRHVRAYYGTDHVPPVDRRDEHEKKPLPRAPYLLQAIRHPSAVNTNTIRGRLRWISEQAGATHADGSPLILTPHDCRRVFASEHLNAHTPVHVIQALLGHATINTVMIYAKLYPDQFVTDYRKAMRGLYTDVHGPSASKTPTEAEWAEFTASCSLRDMGTHVCALPTGEHCPRGLVCLGCGHAQPKKSALPVFRRMLHSHNRALDKAREHGEPAGQIAARELEVERIRSAMQRAQELTDGAGEALEAAATG